MMSTEHPAHTVDAGAKRAQIVVYPSAWKLLVWAIVWGGAAALCIWGVFRGLLDAIPFVLLFATATLYALRRPLQRSPILIIDEEGIYHDVLGLRPQRIAWVDIGSIGRCRMKTSPVGLFTLTYLVITPKDAAAFLDEQTGVLRWLLKRYMATSPAPIMVPQHLLPVSIASIMRELEAQYTPPLIRGQLWDDEKREKRRKQQRQRRNEHDKGMRKTVYNA